MVKPRGFVWLRVLVGPVARSGPLLALLTATAAFAGQPGENVAATKKYTLFPRPNYRYCTDAGDRTQLTDGQTADQYFWTQRGTVGWQGAQYATITVDLERVEPIAGASFRTAAGKAGVRWPGAVHVLTSDDGKRYRDAGDLVALDHKVNGPSWPEGYAIRRLVTSELRTRGRFVRFLILPGPGSPYTFVDEVGVFRGPVELLRGEPGGRPVGDAKELFTRWRIECGVRRRFEADVASTEEAIRRAALADESVKRELQNRLAEAAKQLRSSTVVFDQSFRATLPLNDAHTRLFQIQAELFKERGPLSACIPATWDPLDPFAPLQTSLARIELHTMRGEYRAAALNLLNTTDHPLEVRLHLEGLPGSPTPVYVTLHEVPWTDTVQGRPVAAALPEARRGEKDWRMNLLPGLVSQVWMTFHVTTLPAGEHSGVVVVQSEKTDAMRISVRLHVYPIDFPHQTALLLGGWSYTDGKDRYGITPENRQALVEHLKRHFVNAPWAGSGVMMQYRFAAAGTVELDTKTFDDWIAEWPDARRYHVFLSVGGTFAGARIGTPQFDRRVGAWISAWVRHLKSQGIASERLGLLLHDEPHEGTDVGPLVAWARAIRATEPKVLIWEDPTYRDPTKAPPELFEVADVLCPNRPMWLAQGEPFARFYLDQKRQGRELQFYSCSGPARLLDPYSYYRLQAWHCWRGGATGSFFWAFGDNSGASSWNPYLAKAGPYTPLFLDEKTVTAGKHMEAIRESVEDYEYLVMLRKAVERAKAAGRSDAAVSEAETLLKTAADQVLGAEGADRLRWDESKDRTVADTIRIRILEALTSLANR